MFLKLFLRNLQTGSRLAQASVDTTRRTMQTNFADYTRFSELLGNLKQLKRTGWVLRNVKEPETVASHMYRMAMLSFLIPETSKIDRLKAMQLALVHDLAECIVGDLSPFCGVAKEEKHRREREAITEISTLIPAFSSKEVLDLYEEYESQETPEALWVKDCDRYDLILTAFEYEKRDETPMKHQEFFESTKGKFVHPFFLQLVDELYRQREEYQETFTSELAKKNLSSVR